MFDDDLFPFIEPIVEEDKKGGLFSFITGIGSFFDRHVKRYIFPQSEAGQKKDLDLGIGLTLIGQRGREKLFDRLRLMRERKNTE
ncbi:MAG: hypothetical protein ACJ8BW_04095 [Ktedonobacteraceae bacterium]